ncbi:hypothetical protein GIB67_033816 [Kingdonia uniflora]|uniref:Uncharacterized protein n=1 Tax=Kingdonia uniflora TaxID=39325 RepID=A0A7J7LIL5_9MAGN|nr:hypothetical protein GIB67_033816 [Kingdonia uniflora]
MKLPRSIPLLFLLSLVSSTNASPPNTCKAISSNNNGGETTPDMVPPRREVYDDGRIFDISHQYREDLPAYGSAQGLGQFLWLPASMKNGSLANNSEMKMATHTGTHVDAPGHVFDHYFDAGFDVDTLDLAVLNGLLNAIRVLFPVINYVLALHKSPALLVDVPKDKNITGKR